MDFDDMLAAVAPRFVWFFLGGLLSMAVLIGAVPRAFAQSGRRDKPLEVEAVDLVSPIAPPPMGLTPTEKSAPPRFSATGTLGGLRGESIRIGTALTPRLRNQLQNSVDVGDSYPTPSGRRKLRRVPGALSIRVEGKKAARQKALANLTAATGTLRNWSRESQVNENTFVFNSPGSEREVYRKDRAATRAKVDGAREIPGIVSAYPVFVDPDSGLRLYCSQDLLIRLEEGVNPRSFFGPRWRDVKPLRGTKRHFILHSPSATAETLFEEVENYSRDSRVKWAEPGFYGEVIKHYTPNDTLFPDQWHLNNTGQGSGTSDADVDASEAWDTTTGSSEVVIAIIDDGVQLSHPDLSGNIFSNTGEIANASDSDGNDYIDDLNGWDFIDGDNDPNPTDEDDNHGTSTSGVAAAVGDNNLGVTGIAPNSKILPVKVAGDLILFASLAQGIRYAGGIDDTGTQTWRGADILSLSLGFSQTAVVDAAFADVARFGRNGKGCPIFVSSGNDAAEWLKYRLFGFPAGEFTFRWEYVKDATATAGDDTVWVDSIKFPGGETERFEGGVLPSGWTTGGDANWTNVQEGIGGNQAVTGWDGPGSRAMRAGTIGDRQSSYLETTKTVGAGFLSFYRWISSSLGFTLFNPGAPYYTSSYPLRSDFHDARTQVIYTSSDIGNTGAIHSMWLYISTVPGDELKNWTIRMRHTNLSSYPATPAWETGWTVVLQDDVTIDQTGWYPFFFDTPFEYDDSNNLMVDFSFNNASSSTAGICYNVDAGVSRKIYYVSNSTLGDPLDWAGTSSPTPLTSTTIPIAYFEFGDEFRFSVDGNTYHRARGLPSLDTTVGYPANHPDTIAIGASTDFDYRSDYSQYGADLDFLAPSNGGYSDITTTDRTGADGYDSTSDYDASFGGTSSACPLAAGIAALALSEIPDLSTSEVRSLMRSTADQVGGVTYTAGFNEFYGYGRLNANSLLAALGAVSDVTSHTSPQPDFALHESHVTEASKMRSFAFQIRDGVGDGRPTLIDEIVLDVTGTAGQAANDIAWAELVLDGSGPLEAATMTITNSQIPFGSTPDGNGSASLYSLAEGGTAEFTLNVYLDGSLLGMGGETYVFGVDEDNVGVDSSGSTRMAGNTQSVTPVIGYLAGDPAITVASATVVDASLNAVREIHVADIDGDSDLDILVAATFENDVLWLENTETDASSWTKHSFGASFTRASAVFAADMDKDNDLDVVIAVRGETAAASRIVWCENDGTAPDDGTPWTVHEIDGDFPLPFSIYAVDLDGDMDVDVVGTAEETSVIHWWENTSGDGTTWTEHQLPQFAGWSYSLEVADVDGDNDPDILVASYISDRLRWFENTSGDASTWTYRFIAISDGVRTVRAVDMDKDGDLDALTPSRDDNEISWWENLEGDGLSWSQRLIDSAFGDAVAADAADFDEDGDWDVAGASFFGDEVAWWENLDGDATVWSKHLLDDDLNGALSLEPADLDGDGDTDIATGAFEGDSVVWYENLLYTTILGVSISPDLWAVGPVGLNAVQESSSFTFSNTGNVAQDFSVLGANGTGTSGSNGWTLSAVPGVDSFKLEADRGDDGSYEAVLSTSPIPFATGVVVSASEIMGLRYTAPATDTLGAGIPQDVTITFKATRHVP